MCSHSCRQHFRHSERCTDQRRDYRGDSTPEGQSGTGNDDRHRRLFPHGNGETACHHSVFLHRIQDRGDNGQRREGGGNPPFCRCQRTGRGGNLGRGEEDRRGWHGAGDQECRRDAERREFATDTEDTGQGRLRGGETRRRREPQRRTLRHGARPCTEI